MLCVMTEWQKQINQCYVLWPNDKNKLINISAMCYDWMTEKN